jgi:hypothetical protein
VDKAISVKDDLMSNLLFLNSNSVSDMLLRIMDLYGNGQIEGFVIGVKLKDGEFACGFTDGVSFLEKLGLTQAIINDVHLSANEE